MNRILTLAAVAFVVASCGKKSLEPQSVPGTGEPDVTAPVSFGATAAVEVTPTKSTTTLGGESGSLDVNLGIYAFKGADLPANPTAAAGVVWNDAANLEYAWNSATGVKCFEEKVSGSDKPKLFWPGSGTTGNNLSFAGYFPFVATGTAAPATGTKAWVENYVLNANLADQSTKADDYEFAWASLKNVGRPSPIAAQNLSFVYKVAKLSLVIKSDEAIQLQSGGVGAGIKSVEIYAASTGLNTDYKLNLLTGTPEAGTTTATASAPIKLWLENKTAGVAPLPTKDYVAGGACLIPATAAAINPGGNTTPANNGIIVAVTYNDGTKDDVVLAKINQDLIGSVADGSLDNAALKKGIEAGKNYKYTLTLTKNQITFTGEVTDWEDVEYGSDIPLE